MELASKKHQTRSTATKITQIGPTKGETTEQMDNNSKDQGISTAKQTEKMSADNTESSGTEKTSDDSEGSITTNTAEPVTNE
ncbi:hypothetical protein RCL_jg10353.t1 [Rhizophagus clarus]|uniref:Uncharacterized protein n=1 Tax=Rhizophagus clarus TaxID=94130 RepID=A0A8H3KV30_9GLOM|nr:hypothetical protein RCL_jg10353.t1 [Rhizophagus clarus]